MKKIFLTLVVVSAVTSCSPDVFVAGNKLSSGGQVAMYWKNGKAIILSDSTGDASGDAITVATVGTSNDVYVAGYEKQKGKLSVAKYWKNGIAVSLTDGTKDASATGIVVVGNDVYVSGSEYKDSCYVAKYWKNGTAIALTDGTKQAFANAIAVVGSDVYVAGVENEGQTKQNQIPIAKYWKNGIPTVMPDYLYASVTAIAVAGSDVYIGGSANNIACYWKNGAITLLTKNPFYWARVNAITVIGNDVHAAGFEWQSHPTGSPNKPDSTLTSEVKYWKNGTIVYLWRNASDSDSYANGIAIWGNDIHIAGVDGGATYWKNGTFTVLQKKAVASSIAVKD